VQATCFCSEGEIRIEQVHLNVRIHRGKSYWKDKADNRF